jgi:hypothetical protein
MEVPSALVHPANATRTPSAIAVFIMAFPYHIGLAFDSFILYRTLAAAVNGGSLP